MTWLSVVIAVALLAVLGVSFWRAYRQSGQPSSGDDELAKAHQQRRTLDPLISANRSHLAENSFGPLIKRALGR
jgi:type II secretory pathway component PulJ